MKNYIKAATDICELEFSLENRSLSEDKEIEDYTLTEILDEAEYVLSTYYEGGHCNYENLKNGNEEAKQSCRNLKKFIKKYSN